MFIFIRIKVLGACLSRVWLSGRGGALSGPHGRGRKLQLPSCTARRLPGREQQPSLRRAARMRAVLPARRLLCAAPQRPPRAGSRDGWARAAAVAGPPRPAPPRPAPIPASLGGAVPAAGRGARALRACRLLGPLGREGSASVRGLPQPAAFLLYCNGRRKR